MKIGLFFGSFNPVHIGHLIIANYILNDSELERIWFVVSPQNPFKKSSALLNEHHRLYLLKLGTDGDNRIKVSDIEFKLPRPSYTATTLIHLEEKYPDNQFGVIMGSDSFQNLNKWKNYETIIKNYPIYVYLRNGFEVKNDINANVTILNAPILQISSTEIRQMIKEKKSVRYMVPDEMLEEIERSGYYRK